MKRMDRYQDSSNPNSRLNKNQELYQSVSNNTIYTNITDVTHANAYEIKANTSSRTTREDYQQMQKYQAIEPKDENRRQLENINYLYQNRENRIYDINSFLEEARKNRQEKDALDEKRKLKNNAYNILSGINKEELEKYREEKKKRMLTPEEEEIRELIDTIASKTLAGELDKATTVDLLSDLMATSMLDKVEPMKPQEEEKNDEPVIIKDITEEVQVEVVDDDEEDKTEETSLKEAFENKDSDFYTRSMDLSDKDFNISDDFKEKELSPVAKIIIFILVVAIVAVAAYFIHQKIM